MSDTTYFYSNNSLGSFSDSLPAQCIPQAQKNDRWVKSTLDSLERIGLNQFRENAHLSEYYSMISGDLIFADFLDAPAQLRELEGIMEEAELPTYLKNYDIIGVIIRAITTLYKKNTDKFIATSNDEIATNEFKRRKQELINNYVKEEIDKEINIRMAEQGFTPDGQEFSSQEEQQAFIEQMQQRRDEMAPADIEHYMSKDYSTNFVKWANTTIDQDTEFFDLVNKDVESLTDMLLTGRCFRHYRIGWDFYEPENWRPENTFFSKDIETKDIQDCEYVGRVHFYTPSQIINKYGSQLSEKQIKKIINVNSATDYSGDSGNNSLKTQFERNFHNTKIAPHENYDDYNLLLQIQDQVGEPMGETSIIDKEGNSVKVPRYLPHRNETSGFSPNVRLAQKMRTDLKIRTDLLQVTEAYWEGYKRVGELTYRIPETGRIEIAIVTEDLLEDFLRENEIKKMTNISLEEHAKKKLEDRVDTIIYTYLPVTYEGIKIAVSNRDASEDIYLKGTPMELQLKGNSNVYNNKRPVSGIITDSLAKILRPYQIGYNFAMNQIQNLSEKEIGILFMFDMAMLPAEYRNFGDSIDEVLVNLVNVGRKTGFMPFDSNRQNTQAASGNIPFQAQNLSLTPQIQNCFERALLYKRAAFEQIGITEQMLGAPTKYETAQGVQTSQDASYAQIEKYLDVFNRFKKNSLEMHLNVAQYSKKNNKDIRTFYTDSDMTTALLEFTDEDFYARKLNILPSTNSKKRRELETFKQFIINTNTLADDTLALAEFITSDTTQEVIAIAKESIKRRQQEQAQQQQAQLEQIQAQSQATDELNNRTWQRQESSKDKDRLVDIQVAEIGKSGKETNNNFQKDLFNQSLSTSALMAKQEASNTQFNLQQQEIDRKRGRDETEDDYKERMLALKEKELALREKEIESKSFIAKVNKN